MDYSNLSYHQVNEIVWFLDVMKIIRKLKRKFREEIGSGEYDKSRLGYLINSCKREVEDLMDSNSYGSYIEVLGDEYSIKRKMSKLYEQWELVRIENGESLFYAVENFADKYKCVYSHIELDDDGRLYNLNESYMTLFDLCIDRYINICSEQDYLGNELEEYSSDQSFYVFRIRNKTIERFYKRYINDKYMMKLLTYYIQQLVYICSPYGLILGMYINKNSDYIEVFFVSSFGIPACAYEDEASCAVKDAISIVEGYILKEVVEDMVKEK